MSRPLCRSCLQRPCAVNYYRDEVVHYRSRCENCNRKNRGLKPRKPRWQTGGYVKKMTCDLCRFRAKHGQQILVYHLDGNLDNVDLRNLRSICQNCAIDVARGDLAWRPGDLEPDR